LKSQDDLISFARESLGLAQSDKAELVPFSGRGSDRSYFRFKGASGSVILVQYESTRIENAYFADIAAFLYENCIPVPKIIRHDVSASLILMEDLGDTDLWLLRNAPWKQRQSLYQKTLVAAHKLHSLPESQFPSDRIKLMNPFDPELYQWEREYFMDNFVAALCGIELEPDWSKALEAELCGLAEKLASDRRCLVHRDLQSQNVMIYREEPFLIDFQGMRFGSHFYDLGSLLCDPYVHLTDAERMELLYFYYGLSTAELAWSDFAETFWQASAQRLMQALGAYGFLGIKKELRSYLAHVPAGLRNLRMAAENARALPLLQNLCNECLSRFPLESA
jgi:N-acetylmuramate 1-kinase